MIAQATGVDPAPRILIDNRASVHLDSYADESKAVDRHHRIGATGKGCAEAIVHKIVDRGVKNLILSKWHPFSSGIRFVDTATILSHAYRRGTRIMLEGTQGELLDFHLGEWPYVTSRQTTPAAWVAEAGLSPRLDYEVVLVVRTFPIRVAGNSGRLPLETTWPVLARKINYRLDLMGIPNHPLRVSEEALVAFEDQVRALGIETGVHLTTHHTWTDVERERRCGILSDYAGIVMDRLSWSHQAELRRLFEFTTVTKKLRRVAFADVNTIQETVFRVDPSWVAITFLNYEFPEIHGRTDVPAYARRWADSICPRVEVATTGPMTEHVVTL
jgi:adenylosuccinate synthase